MVRLNKLTIVFLIITLTAFAACSAAKKKTTQAKSSATQLEWNKVAVQLQQQELYNPNLRLPKQYVAYTLHKLADFFDTYDKDNSIKLNVPINGEMLEFSLVNANTMSPELAAKYPELKSLRGSNAKANAAIDYNGEKLSVQVNTQNEIYIVQEYLLKDGSIYYLIYNKKDTGYEKVPFE